jgi:hypothetical protein
LLRNDYAFDIRQKGVFMIGAANERSFHAGVPRFGVPSIAASRLRAAILRHADVILRIALLCGAFVGYALSVAR